MEYVEELLDRLELGTKSLTLHWKRSNIYDISRYQTEIDGRTIKICQYMQRPGLFKKKVPVTFIEIEGRDESTYAFIEEGVDEEIQQRMTELFSEIKRPNRYLEKFCNEIVAHLDTN